MAQAYLTANGFKCTQCDAIAFATQKLLSKHIEETHDISSSTQAGCTLFTLDLRLCQNCVKRVKYVKPTRKLASIHMSLRLAQSVQLFLAGARKAAC